MLSFTVILLGGDFDVSGRVATHDHTTDDVHGQSKQEVSNQTVPEYCYIPE